MTAALVEFLRARVDEEERVAYSASAIGEAKDGVWYDGEDEAHDEEGTRVVGYSREPVIAHIVAWDPARVLAEVASKRKILDDLDDWFETSVGQENWMRVQARAYAAHPAFDPTWNEKY